MRIILSTLCLLLFVSFGALSQRFIDKTKKQVNNRLYLDKKYNFEKSSTETTLTFKTNDPKLTKSERTYHFDKDGKCDSETTIWECEECYQDQINQLIGKSNKWTKVNDTLYVTKKLEMRMHHTSQPYIVVISRADHKDAQPALVTTM